MNTSIASGIMLLILLVILAGYVYYTNEQTLATEYQNKEGFDPRRWWWGNPYGTRWAWRRPWLHWQGNWRPYGYYPAYSGYWKQCDATGTWCPAYDIRP